MTHICLSRSRKAVVSISKELGIVLNETYEKYFKYSMIKLWKFKKDSKSKSRVKILKLMKTHLGRIIRIIDKFVEAKAILLDEVHLEDFKKAKNIYIINHA